MNARPAPHSSDYSKKGSIHVSFSKFLNQLGLELLTLVVFGLFYLILRYLVFRRSMTYPEYGKGFFIFIGAVFFIFSVYLYLR